MTELKPPHLDFSNKKSIELGNEYKDGKGKFRAGEFIAKSFRSEADALEEVQKCNDLAEKGVAVPEAHEYVEHDGEHYVVYSDLSEGNKSQVWSISGSEQDVSISSDEAKEIKEKALIQASLIAGAKYRVKADAFFVVKKDTGEIEIKIADLGSALKFKNEPYGELVDENNYAVKFFMEEIGRNFSLSLS